jgi:hypothetical protein
MGILKEEEKRTYFFEGDRFKCFIATALSIG